MTINDDSYFNIERFEKTISNYGMERHRRILKRRRLRIVDAIMTRLLYLSIIVCLLTGALILYSQVNLFIKDKEIAKLEVALDKKMFDEDTTYDDIKDNVHHENLKMKAFLELNMITPTEKNIIYFDKSGEPNE